MFCDFVLYFIEWLPDAYQKSSLLMKLLQTPLHIQDWLKRSGKLLRLHEYSLHCLEKIGHFVSLWNSAKGDDESTTCEVRFVARDHVNWTFLPASSILVLKRIAFVSQNCGWGFFNSTLKTINPGVMTSSLFSMPLSFRLPWCPLPQCLHFCLSRFL